MGPDKDPRPTTDAEFRELMARITDPPPNEHTFDCGCKTGIGEDSAYLQHCPLHAAAPELLDSMERLVNAVSGVDHDKALCDCRAAIAKAKGGQG